MKSYTREEVQGALNSVGVILPGPQEYDEIAIRLSAIVETIIALMDVMRDDPEALIPFAAAGETRSRP
jgi:hypothetical protein